MAVIIEKGLPINADKGILNGTPVFEGTRVPVSALFDNLAVGVSLDEFLENFPTVKREQVAQIFEYLKKSLDDFGKTSKATVDYLKGRAKRGSREKFLRVLSNAPNVEPAKEDKID